MTGTWTQTGPGRSVYRPGSADDWTIPADALLPFVNQAGLEAVERIRDRWDREVWPKMDAAYERAQERREQVAGGD